MSKIKLSDYIAKRLKEHGVEHFFMVSGGGAMHLNDSLGRTIPYIANHHEQASALAAEGYARVNQKLALVNVTTGPGGLNCLNGVFGQWTDSVPVLYISGQVKFSTTIASCSDIPLRQLGDQEVDIISVVKPLTKYAVTVTEPNEIKYHIDKAVYEATSGRMGPVWLNIPMNVQGAVIDEDNLAPSFFAENEPRQFDCLTQIPTLLDKLAQAKRPLIIAGHGIRLSKQEENFYKLLEKSGIPVVTTFNGFDLMANDNKNYIGRIGTVGQRAGNFALQNADLVLCLGTRNNIRQTSYNWENFAKNAFKIVVDIDQAELDKPTVKPDLAICADLKYFLPELCKKMPEFNLKEWSDYCQNLKQHFVFEQEYTQGSKINPYYFTRELTKQMQENDIFVLANGSACVCSFQVAEVKKGQRYILNSGNASMGFALPAAVGAWYGSCDNNLEDNNLNADNKDCNNHNAKNLGAVSQNKHRNVICLEGDGSIMMNLQELQTIIYNKLPIKIFVINNSGYSSIRQTQRNFFNGHMTGSGADSGVSVPDFVKIGGAFGFKTKRIENPLTMAEEIKDVLNSDGAILCEVMVEQEYAFSPKLSARKLEDGTMISPSLEDMFPFLDREEYERLMIS